MKKLAAAAIAIAPLFLLTGCSKPSEGEVNSAVVQFLEDTPGTADLDKDAIAGCITDEIYADMSRSGLNTLVEDGVDGKVSDGDYDIMEDAVANCASEGQ